MVQIMEETNHDLDMAIASQEKLGRQNKRLQEKLAKLSAAHNQKDLTQARIDLAEERVLVKKL